MDKESESIRSFLLMNKKKIIKKLLLVLTIECIYLYDQLSVYSVIPRAHSLAIAALKI